MSDLAAALLALLLQHRPPGVTAFSVQPASEGVYSSFYGSPVVRESVDAGAARYETIATELVGAVDDILEREKPAGVKRWRRRELVALTAAVAILESGLREDVQVGRGKARAPDDAGGRGRGPGGEACLMQIHPTVFPTFAPGAPISLLGTEPSRVRDCFRAGIRMLVRARDYCSSFDAGRKLPGFDWVWATAAMYGTGTSCSSSNHGKTGLRVVLARTLLAGLRRPAS